jgi:DNA-binding GntR family transcriptional regulator
MPETRRADSIANTLEEMVFTGQVHDGERLDETLLARKFGVSRTPVREALQRLVSSKLAEQRTRRGVFVKQPASITVIEMFETMAEIEAVCGRLAAQRRIPMALEHLAAANALCLQALDQQDADAYSHHNEAFHRMICRCSGH